MASQSASALRSAIKRYLDENGNSPVADDLRRVDAALGKADSGQDSPGRRVAREAMGKSDANAEEPADTAKPNTPGADLNNPPSPAKGKPFPGVKSGDTAKALARLRFKQKAKARR